MYSCILKSNVMNVTVFACVRDGFYGEVCEFGVGGYKGFSTVDALMYK